LVAVAVAAVVGAVAAVVAAVVGVVAVAVEYGLFRPRLSSPGLPCPL
jgi:hypothetical protein